MRYSSRVSKPAVREILDKYLDPVLAERIYTDIVNRDEHDMNSMIGMTCKEWFDRFDYDVDIVWADDTNAGFGKRGWTVSGNLDDCIICSVSQSYKKYTLHVWTESLHSDLEFIKAAIILYNRKHPSS